MPTRKRKRKNFFIISILIAIICLIVLFSKPIFSYGVRALLRVATKNTIGGEIKFKNFELKHRKIVLNKVNIKSKGFFDIEADKLDIELEFQLFKPKIKADIYCDSPKLTIYKNKSWDINLPSQKGGSFLSFFLNIDKGVIDFVDNKTKLKKVNFDFSHHFTSVSKLDLFFDEEVNKKVTIDINQTGEDKDFSCHLDELDTSHVSDILEFFNIDLFQNMKGFARGVVVFGIEKNKIAKFFTNLDLLNFSFINTTTDLSFNFKSLRIEMSYPDFLCKNKNLLLDLIKYDFLKNSKIRLNFDDLTILTSKKSSFSNINGSFSYNPNLGSKMDIEGKIENEKTFDFQIASKAYIASSYSNWLDLDLLLDDDKTKVFVSVKQADDFYNLHLLFDNVRSHIFQAFQDLLSKSVRQIDDFNFNDGNISFCIDSRVNKKGIDKVFVTDLTGNDFDFQKNEIKGFIHHIDGKSSFDLSEKNIFDKFFSDLKITEASFEIADKKIKDLNAKIFILDGFFQSSTVSCDINEIKSLATIKGHIKEFDVLLNLDGKIKGLDDTFSSTVSCKRKKNNYLFYGNIQISDAQEAVFGFDLDKLLILDFKDFQKHLTKAWIRAEKIFLHKWPKILDQDIILDGLANIAAFYNKKKLSLQIKGEKLAFKNPYINIKIDKIGNVNDFIFEGNGYIKATFEKDQLSCDLPAFSGQCFLPKFGLLLDLKEAKLVVNKNILKAKVKSVSQDVTLNGDILFDFSKKYPLLTIDIKDISSDIISMQKLLKHFDFSSDENILGSITGNSKIITSFEDDTKAFYQVNFNIFDGAYKINDKTDIENLKTSLSYSSNQDFVFSDLIANLKLENKSYTLTCPKLNKTKDVLDFDLRLENNVFDLFRFKGNFFKKQNVFCLNVDKDNTHIFSHKFKDFNILIDEKFNIESLEANLKLNSFAFISGLQFLLDSGICPINNVDLFTYIQSKHAGDLDIAFSLDEKNVLAFDVLSKNLMILNRKFNKFIVKGKKSGDQIEVQKFKLDDFEASLALNTLKEALKIEDCVFKKKDELFLKMNGVYDSKASVLNTTISDIKIDLKKIDPFLANFVKLPSIAIEGYLKGSGICQINLPINGNYFVDLDFQPSNLTIQKVRLYNNGAINANFSDKGLLLQGLDLSFYSKDFDLSYLSCKVGKVAYSLDNNKWRFKDTNIYIPASLKSSFEKIDKLKNALKYFQIDDDIDLNCDVELLSDLSKIKVLAKDANFSISSKKHEFKNIFFQIKEKDSFLMFDYLHKNNYYTIQNNFKLDNITRAKTLFKEKNQIAEHPLAVSWNIDENNEIKIKEIVGSFSGLDFMLQENVENINSNQLFGSIKIDNSKLKNILPKNIEDSLSHYNIGSGYEISGLLNLDFSKNKNFSFEGLFSGKDFEMLGFQFKTMFSKILIKPNLIKVTDFKISDQSAIVTINELALEKNNNIWQLDMPHLKIKDLRPSLMQGVGVPLDEMTPFLIRELILNDFKGNLNSKNSFTGSGHFYFINSFKRGHSVFDFPADVLSRIVGIDQELLTPVNGKMEFSVNDAKFNLTKLEDSFSEGQRSKFFLLDKGKRPYIDFDGNIYLNIAMKQYVLFKFTESFAISIRGNLQDPECNLKKKRGFFN
ncbi:MAG: hypothetical protein K940chlam1_00473 [Candidatus Anoxychlamydiales bacterium]|nr:hypothetical protein [Candidatus Anoxychlamydiales bacterium]NGX35613.1 hypothetical protein [Candidatus Anoxychlamydiales bacterium]